jgi:hypothetical protein
MIFYLTKHVLACVLVCAKHQHTLLPVYLSHLAWRQCGLHTEARRRDMN